MASLQDQLLKAGLADSKKAKQIQKEKRKQKKAPKGQKVVDETTLAAQKSMAEKAERDREMNRKLNEQAQQKAIEAQIRQLIDTNRIDRAGGETAHQFTHGKKIKKLYVTEPQHNQLSKGFIAIVEFGDTYELVPSAVAEKIAARNPELVIVKHDQSKQAIDEDDPYADYQIPDDLMW